MVDLILIFSNKNYHHYLFSSPKRLLSSSSSFPSFSTTSRRPSVSAVFSIFAHHSHTLASFSTLICHSYFHQKSALRSFSAFCHQIRLDLNFIFLFSYIVYIFQFLFSVSFFPFRSFSPLSHLFFPHIKQMISFRFFTHAHIFHFTSFPTNIHLFLQ